MIVGLSSVRGAPGVSAWSVLMAAAWPAGKQLLERVVVEADVDGGVAGARYGVGVDPGVLGLVTGLRHGGDPTEALSAVARRLASGAWMVPGPESPDIARRVWSADRAAAAVAEALSFDHRRVWLCDLGRVSATSATAPIVAGSAVTLLFSRDAPADLVQLPSRVETLGKMCQNVGVVVVGSPPYARDELIDFVGSRDVWVVPAASDLIEVSQQVWSTSRRARRTPVWRAAVELAADVSGLVVSGGAAVRRGA